MTRNYLKSSFRSRAFKGLSISFIAFAALALSGAASLSVAYSQTEARQFSAKSGQIVNEALELAKNGNTQSAVNILQQAIGLTELNPYERSMIYQMMGQYSYELDQSVEAQAAFENALRSGGLLPKEADNIEVVIAQLMIGNGQYREGAERLETYLKNGGQEKPEFIELLVNAWIQAEDFRRALPWAEKWFETADPKTREHFDLLNFLFNSLGLQSRQAE